MIFPPYKIWGNARGIATQRYAFVRGLVPLFEGVIVVNLAALQSTVVADVLQGGEGNLLQFGGGILVHVLSSFPAVQTMVYDTINLIPIYILPYIEKKSTKIGEMRR